MLNSADDVPILRGNGQIQAARERIESAKGLVLDPLYKINVQSHSPAAGQPSSLSPTMMDIDYSARMLGRPFGSSTSHTATREIEYMSGDMQTPSSIADEMDDKLTRLRRIGLGPPKRINVETDAGQSSGTVGGKENRRPANSSLAMQIDRPEEPSETNNSNMSLTMTEINVGIIETVPMTSGVSAGADNGPIASGSEPKKDELQPTQASSDTATLNVTSATMVHLIAPSVKDSSGENTTGGTIRSRQVRVNGKVYRVLQLIGRGGSSKVFRVINAEGQIFALKKVNLKNLDETTLAGYTNEIQLLRSFAQNPHIIQLVDSEMNRDQGCLYILMEYGEVDLGRMLKSRSEANGGSCDENFIRFSWQQMLMAVNTVHDAKIVHCDLKPANFLLVQGTLKLIDFGISKAILNDTTNIVRENQVGTVNYMSPEALQESSVALDRGRLKIGRPSDIWSLGCILYEMAFGRPPFAQFTTLIQRLHKILDPAYDIEYPATSNTNGDLIATIQGCLIRASKERLTLQQLLRNPFLRPPRSLVPSTLPPDAVIVSRTQIQSLLNKFAEAYPGINPASLTERIFHQWRHEHESR